MITRRFIRERVLMSIYAFKVSKKSLDSEEKELLKSLEDMKVLYVLMISFIINMKYASIELEKYRKRKKPNYNSEILTNIINSKVIKIFESNSEYVKLARDKKIERYWLKNDNFLEIILKEIEADDRNKRDINDLNDDISFIYNIFVEHISCNLKLLDFFEVENIYWAADVQAVNSLILKTLENIDFLLKNDKLLSLFKNDGDKKFMKTLFLETCKNIESLDERIFEISENWSQGRISSIDIILIEMGIMEYNLYGEMTPPKIIMNEYIEISKIFSSKKSYIFVNGILDKFFKTLV